MSDEEKRDIVRLRAMFDQVGCSQATLIRAVAEELRETEVMGHSKEDHRHLTVELPMILDMVARATGNIWDRAFE